MPEEPESPDQSRISDALREAVNRTVNASNEALDEVSRRGREARDTVSQRAAEAGARSREARETVSQRGQEASAGISAKVAEAVEGKRPVTRDELKALEDQLDRLSRRVSELESKPQVEG